jgi:RNA polymerase sigma-70 factor (ECF subfamily)
LHANQCRSVVPLWIEPMDFPETAALRHLALQRLVDTLPDPYRETLVLRELNDLSYREIAVVAGSPVGRSCRGWRGRAREM